MASMQAIIYPGYPQFLSKTRIIFQEMLLPEKHGNLTSMGTLCFHNRFKLISKSTSKALIYPTVLRNMHQTFPVFISTLLGLKSSFTFIEDY